MYIETDRFKHVNLYLLVHCFPVYVTCVSIIYPLMLTLFCTMIVVGLIVSIAIVH